MLTKEMSWQMTNVNGILIKQTSNEVTVAQTKEVEALEISQHCHMCGSAATCGYVSDPSPVSWRCVFSTKELHARLSSTKKFLNTVHLP